MPVDPIVQRILNNAKANPIQIDPKLPISEQRQKLNEMTLHIFKVVQEANIPLPKVTSFEIPSASGSFSVRVYTPEGTGPFPAYVYFHGGAWWLGDLEQVDPECRDMAKHVGCVVVSVDYHLAPEFKFPTPVEEGYTALRWTIEHANEIDVDPHRLAVGGISAGGNLAAAVALMARDRRGPDLALQLLEIPVLDSRMNTPSFKENGEGYILTRSDMEEAWRYYLRGPEDAEHPYAAPAFAKNLSGLPTALVITCEFDPLRDEGEDYARRLRDAGVEVIAIRCDGMIHGSEMFSKMIPQAQQCREQKIETLRAAFGNPTEPS